MKNLNKTLRVLLLAVVILGGASFSMADPLPSVEPIIFQVGWHDPTEGNGETPRNPINPPLASIDGRTFYINEVHSGFTLYLVDYSGEEPVLAYEVEIPANVNTVILPATFSGTYELQLHNGGAYYFYADVEL